MTIEEAKAAGASRTTLWRIASGKQAGYNPARGKSPKKTWIGLPMTRQPILELIKIGTLLAYPKLSNFDRDDLIQEIIIYLSGKIWDNSSFHDARVIALSKRISNTWRMDREQGTLRYRRSFGTTLLRFGMNVHPVTDWPEDYIDVDFADYHSEMEMQAALNAAEYDSSLYAAFRAMRIRIAHHMCERCDSDDFLTIHHIMPRSVRTENTIENTAVLCRSCHDEVEFVYGMIRVDSEPHESEYERIYSAWMKAPSTPKFLKRYFDEKKRAEKIRPSQPHLVAANG